LAFKPYNVTSSPSKTQMRQPFLVYINCYLATRHTTYPWSENHCSVTTLVQIMVSYVVLIYLPFFLHNPNGLNLMIWWS